MSEPLGPARRLPRLRHHPARRRAAGGAQPLRRRQADHRAPARRARGRLHRGRLAGGQPQGHRVLPPGALPSSTCATPSWRRSARPAGPGSGAADDPLVAALRDSGAGVVTLVAKSHDRHVELALRTTLEENLAMVRDTVAHLRAEGQQVFLDAEHFFDGYRANRDYALEVLRTAYEAGAEVVALCDTNGGMLPDWVADVVHDVIETTGARVGIHCHNDTGCAVANTLAAVDAGATHVQGSINGYGERTGNADLVTVVANLELKLDRPVLPDGLLRESTRIAHAVAEVTNVPPGLAPAVRRHVGVRAQGRPARQRDQGRPEPLPAHGPGRRRQRHAAARLRHGRARLDRAQGPRARLRPVGRRGPGHPGDRPGQGAGAGRLHLRGGRRLLRAAARRGGRGRRPVVLRRRVVAGHHRDPHPRAAGRGGGLRGDGQAASPRACATSSPARATARSTRSTPALRSAIGRPSRRSRSSS